MQNVVYTKSAFIADKDNYDSRSWGHLSLIIVLFKQNFLWLFQQRELDALL